MATVLLGTNSPKLTELSSAVVLIDTPSLDASGDPMPLDKMLSEIRNAFVIHSDAPAAWVEGADDDFTKAVAQTFNCEVGRPGGWDDAEAPEAPPKAVSAPPAPKATPAPPKAVVEAVKAVI